jgi:hypothetical protein
MKITLGGVPSSAGNERPTERAASGARRVAEAQSAPVREAAVAGQEAVGRSEMSALRIRLLLLQQDVARAQQILGGLEGFAGLFASPARGSKEVREEVAAYLERLTYRGETVLEPWRDRLEEILSARDTEGLTRLIEDGRNDLGLLARELSRYETAQQNTRALAAGGDALGALKHRIEEEASSLLDLQPERVLRLLG